MKKEIIKNEKNFTALLSNTNIDWGRNYYFTIKTDGETSEEAIENLKEFAKEMIEEINKNI